MANKCLGWRINSSILENFVEACKAEDKDPRAVLERLMKNYTQKETPSK